MEDLSVKYQVEDGRLFEIYTELEKMPDFSIYTSKEQTTERVLSHLKLTKSNEINFILEIIDKLFNQLTPILLNINH